MLPYAPKYGLRLIAINMRDYADSTPYTDDELAELASSDVEIQASAVRKFEREFGSFMVFVCTSLGIPAVTVLGGHKRGGLAFLTWSLSNIGLVSIFGDSATLEDTQKTVLQRYLRTAFAYGAYSLFACYFQCLSPESPDTPALVYEQFPDLDIFAPLHSPAVPDEGKPKAFMRWASAYYTGIADIERITPGALRNRQELKERTPTLDALSSDELERIVEPRAVYRSMPSIGRVPLSVHARRARRIFLDADAVLPDAKVVALWCDSSIRETLWAAKVLDELLREEPEPGKRQREASLVRIADANHTVSNIS